MPTRSSNRWAAVAWATLAFTGLSTAAPPVPTTTLVGVNASGTGPVAGSSVLLSLSTDGRYALFASDAGDVVPDAPQGTYHLFVRDMKKRKNVLVSADASGAGGGSGVIFGSMSPNGRFVAFASDASDLVPDDANGRPDVFLRDLRTGRTTRVSVGATPTGGGLDPSLLLVSIPSVSANGRLVAFASDAGDLLATDANPSVNVFVRDLKTRTTRAVSTGADGKPATGLSTLPRISANGGAVTFVSDAPDLADGDGNGAADVFVRDLRKGAVTLVSVRSDGAGSASGPSGSPTISANGRHVAFESAADDVVDGDANGAGDVFVRDVKARRTLLVSVGASGTAPASGVSQSPSISGSGSRVAFSSEAEDVASNDANGFPDVFVRDVKAGRTTLVSVNALGTASGAGASNFAALSANGRAVGFSTNADDLGVPLGVGAFVTAVVRPVR